MTARYAGTPDHVNLAAQVLDPSYGHGMVGYMANRDEADREIRRVRSAAYSACAAGATPEEILAAVQDAIGEATAATNRTAAIMADADREYQEYMARQRQATEPQHRHEQVA
jgi:hypothetical protein